MNHLAQILGMKWVEDHLTIFADDCCIAVTFSSADDLKSELRNIGVVIATIESFGLQICSEKSHALCAIGGSSSAKHQSQVIQRHSHGANLLIPRPNGTVISVPLTDRVKYLGVLISFKNLEDLSLEFRLQMAKISFGRLKRWLCNRRMPLASRLSMWKTCIVSVLHYGLA